MKRKIATFLMLLHVVSTTVSAYGAVAMGMPVSGEEATMAKEMTVTTQDADSALQATHCDDHDVNAAHECDACAGTTGCNCCHLCCSLYFARVPAVEASGPVAEISDTVRSEHPTGTQVAVYRPPRF